MKALRILSLALLVLFTSISFSYAATYELIGFKDLETPGILSDRYDWSEIAEVENVSTDPRITAAKYFAFNVAPGDWNSGLWISGSPGYVQTVFDNPSDSLFVQFESDGNDGPADFYVDGVKELSLNTNNGTWFAVVFKDLTWSAHTLRVEATSSSYPRDIAIDVMGSGAPVPIPGAIWLLGPGLLWLAQLKKRFRKS